MRFVSSSYCIIYFFVNSVATINVKDDSLNEKGITITNGIERDSSFNSISAINTGTITSSSNSASSKLLFPIGNEMGITSTTASSTSSSTTSSSSSISQSVLKSIIHGVEKKKKESIYYYGLLKLYGISMVSSPSEASIYFLEAAQLGHREAMTAYSVLIMSDVSGKAHFSTNTATLPRITLKTAVYWLEQAILLEDMNAHWLLAKVLIENPDIVVSNQSIEAKEKNMNSVNNNNNDLEVNKRYDNSNTVIRVSDDDNTNKVISDNRRHDNNNNSDRNFFQAAVLLQRVVSLAHTDSHSYEYPQALHLLGLLYEYGYGVRKSYAQAIQYYQQASQHNYVDSTYNLGLMYTYGRGGRRDYTLAWSLFERASQLGHTEATYYLGIFKLYGYGCTVNYKNALNWFELAAAGGGGNDDDDDDDDDVTNIKDSDTANTAITSGTGMSMSTGSGSSGSSNGANFQWLSSSDSTMTIQKKAQSAAVQVRELLEYASIRNENIMNAYTANNQHS